MKVLLAVDMTWSESSDLGLWEGNVAEVLHVSDARASAEWERFLNKYAVRGFFSAAGNRIELFLWLDEAALALVPLSPALFGADEMVTDSAVPNAYVGMPLAYVEELVVQAERHWAPFGFETAGGPPIASVDGYTGRNPAINELLRR